MAAAAKSGYRVDRLAAELAAGSQAAHPGRQACEASPKLEAAAVTPKGRVVIENVTPRVDDGHFPVKRVVGDTLVVEADVFADGHDELRAVLRTCAPGAKDWQETEMEPLGNDRWRAAVTLTDIGRWQYDVAGWVDPFRTWQHDFKKRVDAKQEVTVDLQIGVATDQGCRQARRQGRQHRPDRTGTAVDGQGRPEREAGLNG